MKSTSDVSRWLWVLCVAVVAGAVGVGMLLDAGRKKAYMAAAAPGMAFHSIKMRIFWMASTAREEDELKMESKAGAAALGLEKVRELRKKQKAFEVEEAEALEKVTSAKERDMLKRFSDYATEVVKEYHLSVKIHGYNSAEAEVWKEEYWHLDEITIEEVMAGVKNNGKKIRVVRDWRAMR